MLNAGFNAAVFIDVSTGYLKEVVDSLKKFDEVHELSTISYSHDLLAFIRTKDAHSCFKLLIRIFDLKKVERNKTMVIFDAKELPFKFRFS